jgi:endonuclease YncB( thermonuclease family)
MYEYAAQVLKVTDGDTFHLDVTLVDINPGLDLDPIKMTIQLVIRLYGVNAPELKTAAGKTAKAWVEQWLTDHAPDGQIVLHTMKDRREKYGRYLGIMFSLAGDCLNDDLVASGNAVPYMVD